MSHDDRDSHVFPRDASLTTRHAVAAEGCYVIDDAGRRYLDGSGGAAVSGFGHSHPTILAAIRRHLDGDHLSGALERRPLPIGPSRHAPPADPLKPG